VRILRRFLAPCVSRYGTPLTTIRDTSSAAIRDAGAVVAALSIPVPTARFAGQEERLAGMLLRTCAEVSATLRDNGHAPDLHATSLATLGNDLATV
jgi:hypothetical protein